MSLINKILENLKNRSTANLSYELIVKLSNDQEELLSFVKTLQIIKDIEVRLIEHSLSFTVDFLQEKYLHIFFNDLIDSVLKEEAKDYHYNLMRKIGIQYPYFWHGHSDLIFKYFSKNTFQISSNFVEWFDTDEAGCNYLKKILEDDNQKDNHKAVFYCMLQTRNEKLLEYAINKAAKKIEFTNYECQYTSDNNVAIELLLNDATYYREDDEIKKFTSSDTYYFQFPKNYWGRFPVSLLPVNNLLAEKEEYEIGGIVVNSNNVILNHIITLDVVVLGKIGVLSVKRLILAVDFIYLFWKMEECLFYQHDEDGVPFMISSEELSNDVNKTGYKNIPIKKTKIKLALSPRRWERQDERFDTYQIGGEPKWVQSSALLTCPICKKKMHFLMQLGDSLLDEDECEIMFGAGGSCYAFWCDKDRVSGFTWQST